MIKELIVVEGKDDISAVKKAVDAEVICTNGFGITKKILNQIKFAAGTTGVIIFTDPDFAGEKIRKYINNRVNGCKNAYLPRRLGNNNGNIGIENAKPQDIKDALSQVKTVTENKSTFTISDMYQLGLMMGDEAARKREAIGEILGMGYCNGKQFLNRLNYYGITIEQIINALNKYNRMCEKNAESNITKNS